MSAAVDGSPLKAGRTSRCSDCQRNLAVGGAFAHRMPKVVGEVEHVVGATAAPWELVKPISSPQERRIFRSDQDDDWMTAARENVDIVLAVDADGSAVAIGIAGGSSPSCRQPDIGISPFPRMTDGDAPPPPRRFVRRPGAEEKRLLRLRVSLRKKLSTCNRTKVAHGHLPGMSLLRHTRKETARLSASQICKGLQPTRE